MRLAPALLLAAALACARTPAGPSGAAAGRRASPGDYFPLAVGNTWTWLDESPGLPPSERGRTRTVRILERTADGFFRDSERGELRADGECVRDRVRRLLCAPLEAGNGWSSVVSVSSTERYEIAAVGEKVRTPAGEFAGALRVRAHNRAPGGADHVLEITYAPGVGPVRIETFAVVKGQLAPQVRAVLQSYRIEGK